MRLIRGYPKVAAITQKRGPHGKYTCCLCPWESHHNAAAQRHLRHVHVLCICGRWFVSRNLQLHVAQVRRRGVGVHARVPSHLLSPERPQLSLENR